MSNRLPSILQSKAYTRLAANLDLARLDKEWRQGRELPEILKEVDLLIQTRGPVPELIEIRRAMNKLIQKEQSSQSQPTPEAKVAANEDEIQVDSFEKIPNGFKALGGGFYRDAHSVWELRSAEDSEGGYVLTRKREERAVDLVKNPVEASAKESDPVVFGMCPSCLKIGSRVAWIKDGQVVPVIVVNVEDGATEAKVKEEETQEESMAPLDMLVTEMSAMPIPAPGAPMMATPPMPAPMPVQMPTPMMMEPSPGLPIEMPIQDMAKDMAPQTTGTGVEAPHGCDCQLGCPCPCHNGKSVKKGPVQGMEPKIEPTSKEDSKEDAGPAERAPSEDSSGSGDKMPPKGAQMKTHVGDPSTWPAPRVLQSPNVDVAPDRADERMYREQAQQTRAHAKQMIGGMRPENMPSSVRQMASEAMARADQLDRLADQAAARAKLTRRPK